MSILVVVITFLAVEYKDARHYAPIGAPIRNAIVGTTVASIWAGALALVSLYKLRPEQWSATLLVLAFGLLIAALMVGILCVGFSLIA